MKQSLSHLAVAMMAIISLVVMGCSSSSNADQDETPSGFTEAESRQIAREYLENSPTYDYDGIEGSIKLISTETLRCPQCWMFVFEFNSAHAGYGDRTGQVLAQVITTHTARITIQEGKVARAVIDEKWNMMEQEEMFTEDAARKQAEEFIKTSPTFVFDGMPETLKLVETLYPDIENAWQFVFRFDSRHAGYGDRTGQMLAQVITPHEAVITVENGLVANAVLDQKWDIKGQAFIGGEEPLNSDSNDIQISCDEFQAENHIVKNVTLSVGETIGVQLCSNPTTGFRWEQPQISDSSIIMALDRHYQAPPPSDESIVGAPGKRMLDIQAQKAGTCTLSMDYSRAWEGGEKGVWTFTMHITVVDG